MALHLEFPQPTHYDGQCLVVHRDVIGEHEESRLCWCRPTVFNHQEMEALTAEKLNALAEKRLDS